MKEKVKVFIMKEKVKVFVLETLRLSIRTIIVNLIVRWTIKKIDTFNEKRRLKKLIRLMRKDD